MFFTVFIYIFKLLIIYLIFFLAVLGLCCCTFGLFYSCGVQASHCSGFSHCRAWALECVGIHRCGTWALEHMAWALLPRGIGESSQARNQTHVPCIGRQILNYWTTKKILFTCFKLIKVFCLLILKEPPPSHIDYPF